MRQKERIIMMLLDYLWNRYQDEIYLWAMKQTDEIKAELLNLYNDKSSRSKQKLTKRFLKWKQRHK